MNMQEIGEFKYPNRKPILLIIIVVIIGVIGFRWYKGGYKILEKNKSGHWSCSIFHRNNKPVEIVPQASIRKPAEQKVQPVQTALTNQPAVVNTDTNWNADIREAIALEDGKSFVNARKKYLELLKKTVDSKVREEIEHRLGKINIDLILTPTAMPEKQEYVVRAGDSLEKIAKKYGTTVDLIHKSNLLSSHVIKAGDRLMVLAGKFAIKVSKARNDMCVTLNDEFFCRYGVGTGKFGKTPVGVFVVNDKIKEPVWWRPDGREIPFGDPENILGTRWMSIKASGADTPDVKGYGIHGTWDETSIGKAESAGCIRMKNSEVEQLFVMVPVGTVVTITEQ
ncbi:MAG: L,D-transpeptidase family protein [Kiritimatiellae bacterium]|nr:L,D-transpeptidase family protein [Kiritimatiellia bacterium]MDD5520424.1 L,D-transpeptidase family protein [Kiritimatiellia bacterium]